MQLSASAKAARPMVCYIGAMKSDLFALHADIEERHWWFVARRAIVRRLARLVVPPSRDSLVIDIGCGTGANAAAFATDYSCLAIDTSRDAVAAASRRYPDVSFVCGQAPSSIPAAMGRAALFLLTDVLEHVADDFAVLSAILGEARPGAHVLITVPAHERLWSEHDTSFGHYRRYDRARLAAVWQGLPVSVRLLSFFNTRLYPIVRTVRSVSRLRGRASGRSGTDFRMPPASINRALQAVFAGELRRLQKAVDQPNDPGYGRGVSLIALLRRESGGLTPRTRPASIPIDLHQPLA